ncbi:MAG TPA: hypothetical protein VGN74_03925 [Brevundimonas sp.]|jgi:hypothetical protein|uniref:hypothetical protein n=1 Tax=Brevundimonas sp. TaxID=1871086 RepID=UPI002E0FCD06|nr:hypothetical protein [Brevundimonas sp.]
MSVARTIVAFAAAPFASGFALGATLSASSGAEPASWFFGALVYAFFGLLFTVPAAVIGGLPSFLILKAFRRDSLPWFVAAGAIVGLLSGGLILASGGTPDEQREPGWILLLMTTGAGAVGGAVFGLVRGPSRSWSKALHVP